MDNTHGHLPLHSHYCLSLLGSENTIQLARIICHRARCLGFTHVCSLVNIITPWPEVFGMFIVGRVIQFTFSGCTGLADDFHVITDAVVFHVA